MGLLSILFYAFTAVIVIQLIYYWILFRRISFSKKTYDPTNTAGVSVIIAAKNESKNLKENLPFILNQDYPNFEVIIINDASTDDSLQVAQLARVADKKIKIINIPNTDSYKGNKKNAITKGVESASFEQLLFTDADCKPGSTRWISEMGAGFTESKTLVLGYGAYNKTSNSFLNKLIRYETLLTATQYFSYALAGIPYMGVGRNLAYKKQLFKKTDGLEAHKHIKSGDDDLFINKAATAKNTSCIISKNSFTYSQPKMTFKSWFHQKRRHITTSKYYKPIHKVLLTLFFLSQFLCWLLAIILISFSFKWQLVIGLLLIRLISQYYIIGTAAKKLDEKDLIMPLPLLDLVTVFLQMGLFLSNLIQKPTRW